MAVRTGIIPALLASAVAIINISVGAGVSFHGQASGWLSGGRDTSVFGQSGLRYIPTLSVTLPFHLDAEASVNAYASSENRDWDEFGLTRVAKPYRLWLRYSPARLEARAGLQKINFGSATLLRPLQWFDRVDPRDPLALTDGVYGLLACYYFQNNANLWAWGLLGNSSRKGWERVGSVRWKPELGGRAQLPVPRGEAAVSFHHRVIDLSGEVLVPELLPRQAEDRIGLDAKLDVGVGLCVEGILVREQQRMVEGAGIPTWTHLFTVGFDYTIGVGAGLTATAEHMFAGIADSPLGNGIGSQFSAFLLGLPLGLVDNVKGIVYYDWTNRVPYNYLGWQRTFDRWLFSLGGFWNPDKPVAVAGSQVASVAGKGFRLDVVYSH